MIRKTLLLALLAIGATASAQVLINADGKMHIGDRLPYNNALKGFNGQLPAATGAPALAAGGIVGPGITYPDSVSADSKATLALLGTAANNSGAYISFGDFSHVGVGEYGGYDSDILGLYGGSGIIYSYNANKLTDSTRGQVFYWKPSPNYSAPFVFNVDLKVNGVAIASDMRLKEDVVEIEDASASLADITPVTYRLTERAAAEKASKASAISEGDDGLCEALKPDNRKRYGFVAQEVKEIFPDLVMEDEEGYLSVDYIGFIPLLVDAVKDLQAKVDDQTKVIAALEEEKGIRKVAQNAGLDLLDGESVVLAQNKPNPFTANTVIEYSLPESVAVASLHIYDLRGTQIQSIQLRERGKASVTIDGSTLQPGMYIYTLVADGQEAASKRMILTD